MLCKCGPLSFFVFVLITVNNLNCVCNVSHTFRICNVEKIFRSTPLGREYDIESVSSTTSTERAAIIEEISSSDSDKEIDVAAMNR